MSDNEGLTPLSTISRVPLKCEQVCTHCQPLRVFVVPEVEQETWVVMDGLDPDSRRLLVVRG